MKLDEVPEKQFNCFGSPYQINQKIIVEDEGSMLSVKHVLQSRSFKDQEGDMLSVKCPKLTVYSAAMQCIAVVVASVVALATGSSVNYCGSRMCANTNAHTFCQFPEGPSHDCVGYINAPLTLEEKSRVIARLNRRRNEAAAGKMKGFPSAGDMLKLRWVEELAREAQRWADQCRPWRQIEEHDACRNLYSLSVGQCVASVVGEAPGLRIESMVDIWYMQKKSYKGNITFYVLPSHNTSFYGDFGQIMWAQTYMVGCGRSRFMTPWQDRLRSVERLVCNFAPHGPPPSRPLWSPAAPAVSCPSRSQRDGVLQALCDYQHNPKEITVVDPSMTLEDHILLDTVLEIENNGTLDYLGSLDEIYLTKLTIATMSNTLTTQVYFNSMQRRDVVEVIDTGDPQLNITAISLSTVPPEGTASSMAAIVVLAPEEETTANTNAQITKTPKKKVSLIGRPKSYNMEDLTNLDEKAENNTPIEEKPNREKEFYAEYEFVEPVDENATWNSIEITNTTEVPEIVNSVYTSYKDMDIESSRIVTDIEIKHVAVLINQDVLRDVVTRLYQNSSMLYGGPVQTFFENAVVQSGVLSQNDSDVADSAVQYHTTVTAVISSTQESGNVSLKDNLDEYLSDPETVRELQEALDRIEHDMASTAGKVRRELRNPNGGSESTTIDKVLLNAIHDAEVARNRTLERGPMYNMVLKYMPYLKQYEGGLLSKSDDASCGRISRLSVPSVIIVLVFTWL